MSSGAGRAPAGSSSAGYGVPTIVVGPGATPTQTTALIDPATRDYTYDATGNRTQGSIAQQRVYLACLTALDSSSVAGFGLEPAPQTITVRYKQQRLSAFARVFAPLQSEGVAKLLDVQVAILGSGRTSETVRWSDLSTTQEQTTTF